MENLYKISIKNLSYFYIITFYHFRNNFLYYRVTAFSNKLVEEITFLSINTMKSSKNRKIAYHTSGTKGKNTVENNIFKIKNCIEILFNIYSKNLNEIS